MITTSNFAKSGKHPDAVAISQGVPRFYRVKTLPASGSTALASEGERPRTVRSGIPRAA